MQEIFECNGAADGGTSGGFVEQLQELVGLWKLELLTRHKVWGKESKQATA